MSDTVRGSLKVVGGKLLGVCPNCGKIVRVDKPLFGGLHLCTTDEEREMYGDVIRRRVEAMKAELDRA